MWLGRRGGKGLYPVGLQAHQFFLLVVVAKAIAVVQHRVGFAGFQLDEVFAVAQPLADLGDPAYGLTGVFGAVECANVFLAALHKVISEFAVEVLVGVGGEGVGAAPMRCGSEFGAAFQNFVQQGAVMGGDVFDIAHVFVAAFNFEAPDACIDQRFHVGALVVVFHAQHMLVVGHKAALGIHHLIGQATCLAAIAPVGAAPCVRVADVALATVRNAQRTMHKKFEYGGLCRLATGDGMGCGQRIAHLGYLGQGQLTGQYQLAHACILQKTGFGGCADVALRAGMQLDGGQVQLQQTHVLNDEGIHSCVVQLPHQFTGGLQLIVAQDGVDGDKNAAVKAVSVFHQPGNVAHAVVRTGPCPEPRSTDVNRIGPVVDGFHANVGSAGGGEQFELVGEHGWLAVGEVKHAVHSRQNRQGMDCRAK